MNLQRHRNHCKQQQQNADDSEASEKEDEDEDEVRREVGDVSDSKEGCSPPPARLDKGKGRATSVDLLPTPPGSPLQDDTFRFEDYLIFSPSPSVPDISIMADARAASSDKGNGQPTSQDLDNSEEMQLSLLDSVVSTTIDDPTVETQGAIPTPVQDTEGDEADDDASAEDPEDPPEAPLSRKRRARSSSVSSASTADDIDTSTVKLPDVGPNRRWVRPKHGDWMWIWIKKIPGPYKNYHTETIDKYAHATGLLSKLLPSAYQRRMNKKRRLVGPEAGSAQIGPVVAAEGPTTPSTARIEEVEFGSDAQPEPYALPVQTPQVPMPQVPDTLMHPLRLQQHNASSTSVVHLPHPISLSGISPQLLSRFAAQSQTLTAPQSRENLPSSLASPQRPLDGFHPYLASEFSANVTTARPQGMSDANMTSMVPHSNAVQPAGVLNVVPEYPRAMQGPVAWDQLSAVFSRSMAKLTAENMQLRRQILGSGIPIQNSQIQHQPTTVQPQDTINVNFDVTAVPHQAQSQPPSTSTQTPGPTLNSAESILAQLAELQAQAAKLQEAMKNLGHTPSGNIC